MTLPKRNAIVAVTFLDHVENDQKPTRVTAYGKLVKIRPDCVVINAWVGEDDEVVNNKFFTVLRSTIQGIKELR